MFSFCIGRIQLWEVRPVRLKGRGQSPAVASQDAAGLDAPVWQPLVRRMQVMLADDVVMH